MCVCVFSVCVCVQLGQHRRAELLLHSGAAGTVTQVRSISATNRFISTHRLSRRVLKFWCEENPTHWHTESSRPIGCSKFWMVLMMFVRFLKRQGSNSGGPGWVQAGLVESRQFWLSPGGSGWVLVVLVESRQPWLSPGRPGWVLVVLVESWWFWLSPGRPGWVAE